jgi:hypothetical protein
VLFNEVNMELKNYFNSINTTKLWTIASNSP